MIKLLQFPEDVIGKIDKGGRVDVVHLVFNNIPHKRQVNEAIAHEIGGSVLMLIEN